MFQYNFQYNGNAQLWLLFWHIVAWCQLSEQWEEQQGRKCSTYHVYMLHSYLPPTHTLRIPGKKKKKTQLCQLMLLCACYKSRNINSIQKRTFSCLRKTWLGRVQSLRISSWLGGKQKWLEKCGFFFLKSMETRSWKMIKASIILTIKKIDQIKRIVGV